MNRYPLPDTLRSVLFNRDRAIDGPDRLCRGIRACYWAGMLSYQYRPGWLPSPSFPVGGWRAIKKVATPSLACQSL